MASTNPTGCPVIGLRKILFGLAAIVAIVFGHLDAGQLDAIKMVALMVVGGNISEHLASAIGQLRGGSWEDGDE